MSCAHYTMHVPIEGTDDVTEISTINRKAMRHLFRAIMRYAVDNGLPVPKLYMNADTEISVMELED